jgi:hypothetical protein
MQSESKTRIVRFNPEGITKIEMAKANLLVTEQDEDAALLHP